MKYFPNKPLSWLYLEIFFLYFLNIGLTGNLPNARDSWYFIAMANWVTILAITCPAKWLLKTQFFKVAIYVALAFGVVCFLLSPLIWGTWEWLPSSLRSWLWRSYDLPLRLLSLLFTCTVTVTAFCSVQHWCNYPGLFFRWSMVLTGTLLLLGVTFSGIYSVFDPGKSVELYWCKQDMNGIFFRLVVLAVIVVLQILWNRMRNGQQAVPEGRDPAAKP